MKAYFITILLLAACFFSGCNGRKEAITHPIIAPVTEAVFAPGHIEAGEQFTLTSLNEGYINELLVEEGDIVAPEQVLLLLDNKVAAVQQRTAAHNLHIAQQQAAIDAPALQQLQAQLNAAGEKLAYDRSQLDRMRRLYTTRSVAKLELDNAQLSYDNSLSNVQAIRENISATRLNLEQAVVNSEGQEQTAAINNGYFSIRSPGNYKVYSLLKKKGELVRKGEAIAVMGSATQLKVILNIDEASIRKVKIQQKVLVELNSQKGVTYPAHISKMSPVFDAGSQAYTAEAVLDTAAVTFINGTLLQANIIVDARAGTMLIPRSYLDANGNVLVRHGKKTDTVSIKTGIISVDWVEVLAGLKTTDLIVKQE